MNYFQRIRSFANYILKSETKFRIHSPFVYDLIVNVLEDHTNYEEYIPIELRKRELENDHRPILRRKYDIESPATNEPIPLSQLASREVINRRYGRLLFRLVKKFTPDNILEIGTSFGISSSYMAAANPESRLYTLEGCRDTSTIARETFGQFKTSVRIELIDGNFDRTLPELIKRIKKLDFVFIDGNHKKDAALKYFDLILPISNNDTVVVIDDIHWSYEMENAWDIICGNEKVKVTVDIFRLGMVFFKKELSKQDFIIRYS